LNFTLRPLILNFWSFFLAANIISFPILALIYFIGRRSKEYKPYPQTWTPQWLNDFWFGPTLNPKLWGVDLKVFFYQPSLIGLQLFLFAFAEYQYDTYGLLTNNMILFQTFWWLYIFTHYIKEEFMLSTWDIIDENLGFMLVWGDLCVVPFWYSVGGWYLADRAETIEGPWVLLLLLFHLVSHYILRESNWQKFEYKKHGMKAKIWGQEPKLIGNKLLVSGFWGIGRHLNHTGEILTYLSMTMCCGVDDFLPHLLPLFVTILLVQRTEREEKKCQLKYGELWDQYCKIATFKLVCLKY